MCAEWLRSGVPTAHLPRPTRLPHAASAPDDVRRRAHSRRRMRLTMTRAGERDKPRKAGPLCDAAPASFRGPRGNGYHRPECYR